MRALCVLCPGLAKPCKPRAEAEWQPRFCLVCGTWGTYGALLSRVDTARYESIILLNSEVRGPFLPSYVPVSCRSKCINVHPSDASCHCICIT